MLQLIRTTVALLVLTFASTGLQAGLITFDLEYSGAPYGNAAIGTGSVTFDDANLPNPGLAYPLTVLDFSLTITGAAVGNGIFGLSDVDTFVWQVGPNPVDLGAELVGQADFLDFNVFAAPGSGAPYGVNPFIFITDEGAGEPLTLISMTPQPAAVPAPSTLLLLGLLLPLVARLRRGG